MTSAPMSLSMSAQNGAAPCPPISTTRSPTSGPVRPVVLHQRAASSRYTSAVATAINGVGLRAHFDVDRDEGATGPLRRHHDLLHLAGEDR